MRSTALCLSFLLGAAGCADRGAPLDGAAPHVDVPFGDVIVHDIAIRRAPGLPDTAWTVTSTQPAISAALSQGGADVRFAPLEPGALRGRLDVLDAGGTAVAYLHVHGRARAPALRASPARLDFGPVGPLDTRTARVQVERVDGGRLHLTLDEASPIAICPAVPFCVTSGSEETEAGATSWQVELTSPATAGDLSKTLRLSACAHADCRIEVAVTAQTRERTYTLEPETLHLDTRHLCAMATVTATITNSGAVPILVSPAQLAGPDAAGFSMTESGNILLGAGETRSFTVGAALPGGQTDRRAHIAVRVDGEALEIPVLADATPPIDVIDARFADGPPVVDVLVAVDASEPTRAATEVIVSALRVTAIELERHGTWARIGVLAIGGPAASRGQLVTLGGAPVLTATAPEGLADALEQRLRAALALEGGEADGLLQVKDTLQRTEPEYFGAYRRPEAFGLQVLLLSARADTSLGPASEHALPPTENRLDYAVGLPALVATCIGGTARPDPAPYLEVGARVFDLCEQGWGTRLAWLNATFESRSIYGWQLSHRPLNFDEVGPFVRGRPVPRLSRTGQAQWRLDPPPSAWGANTWSRFFWAGTFAATLMPNERFELRYQTACDPSPRRNP